MGKTSSKSKTTKKKKTPPEGRWPFGVGDAVFIRTVTHHHTGRIADYGSDWFKLVEAAWIGDDGRFHNFLKSGPTNETEIEPIPDFVVIGRGALIDLYPWPHELPKVQK